MPNLNNADLKQLRSDFELSMLFDNMELTTKETASGCLVKDANGLYLNNFIEAAWRGFQMHAKSEVGLNERFEPTRYISPGMRAQFRALSTYQWEDGADSEEELDDYFRTALVIAAGSPI